jgi:hypothetical protein
MTEAHQGFKVSVVKAGGYRWMWTIHMGTSGQGRACIRHHDTNFKVIRDDSTLELIADLHWHGDYGYSRAWETPTPLTPSNCYTQSTDGDVETSAGSRRISVDNLSHPNKPYEPWRPDIYRTAFGFKKTSMTGNTSVPALTGIDFATTCATTACNTLVNTGEKGALRVLDMAGIGIDTARADATGTFYTDPKGEVLRSSTATDRTVQYIKPGFNAYLPGCNDTTNPFHNRRPMNNSAIGTGTQFVCANSVIDMDPENTLLLPN